MKTHERRAVLETLQNPDTNLNYKISLSGTIQTQIGLITPTNIKVELYYIPDRVITKPDPWRTYLNVLSNQSWTTLEELSVTALSDINDQLIPRWMELSIISLTEESKHLIVLNESHPEWDNPPPYPPNN